MALILGVWRRFNFLCKCRLAGRGTVEITIEKGDGSTFSPEAGGDQRKSATIQVIIWHIWTHNSEIDQILVYITPHVMLDSGCYWWVFGTFNSREFCKTGKVVYSTRDCILQFRNKIGVKVAFLEWEMIIFSGK